ncbi:MAG TPA: hydrolase 1, exosortase A system-associated [Burkholderiaceae bacterium]
MNFHEQALQWRCEGEATIGIASLPAMPNGDLGLLIIVGGPQYRVGSHRQFALLARRLAAEGFATLRFDVRGMGDSEGEARSFETLDADIAAAIDALQASAPQVKRVALWGLCDAASAALLYTGRRADPRVVGLALLNPWVRSAATLARTHVKHYYWQRLREPAFWRKLLGGGVALKALRDLARNVRLARQPAHSESLSYQAAMAQAALRFAGPQLLLLSGTDYTAKEFVEYAAASPDWLAALACPGMTRHELPQADHTFSNAATRRQVEDLTLAWLQQVVHQQVL